MSYPGTDFHRQQRSLDLKALHTTRPRVLPATRAAVVAHAVALMAVGVALLAHSVATAEPGPLIEPVSTTPTSDSAQAGSIATPGDTLSPATATPSSGPQLLGAQLTVIRQHLYPFPAAYEGTNSLVSTGDDQSTQSYGLYGGWRIAAALHAYLDVEMLRGNALGDARGLAALPNGDVLRVGTVDLGNGPYVARAYLHTWIALGAAVETPEATQDQLAAPIPTHRIEFKLGKISLSDDFDQNRYANTTRTQFMNWALIDNTAWDYAADTRGYTNGVLVGWVQPQMEVNFGVFQMPTFANGNTLDPDLARARGENLQLTLRSSGGGDPANAAALRLIVWRNLARMGIYREAIEKSAPTGLPPDIAADDEPGRIKWGWAASGELPLAHGGETGLFARIGWNDGKTESFAYTEADAHLSVGVQVAGVPWGRPTDRFGFGAVTQELSPDHRDYLAAGGLGFVLGDGHLSYGPENVIETYYRVQLGRFFQVTPDYQYYENPGFNRDRGPIRILTIRLRASWQP